MRTLHRQSLDSQSGERRGLGKLQRRLLATLEQHDHGRSARHLADEVGGSYESVRRALRSLLQRQLIADEGPYLPIECDITTYERYAWHRHYTLPGREYWRSRDSEQAREVLSVGTTSERRTDPTLATTPEAEHD